MASGRKTLSEIEDAIGDVRAREKVIQNELEASTQERAKLLEQRTSAFREMASVRATAALADGVIDRADRLSHRVAALLSARQKTIDALKARLAEASEAYEARLKQSRPLQTEIAALEDELDGYASRSRAALLETDSFRALNTQLESLEGMRGKAHKKAVQAREDRVQKGRAFETDVLFMYLWNRGYRREGYKPHPIVRWADDKVARLIGFNDARANYAVLIEIPRRLSEHVDRLDERLDAASLEIEKVLSDKTAELAGEVFLGKLSTARNQENEINAAIEDLSAEMAEISTQLNLYAEGRDPSFLSAVEMSAQFLEQASYRRLVKLARSSVSPTDDEIVARVAQIDNRSAALSTSVEGRRSDLDKLAKRREELIRVAADFRRSHYDQPGSIFIPDGDLSFILGELVKGAITGAEYWARAQRRHRWSARSGDPFRRRSGMPPFGGSDFGRVFRPGGSGGGGRGGGFGTGGGF